MLPRPPAPGGGGAGRVEALPMNGRGWASPAWRGGGCQLLSSPFMSTQSTRHRGRRCGIAHRIDWSIGTHPMIESIGHSQTRLARESASKRSHHETSVCTDRDPPNQRAPVRVPTGPPGSCDFREPRTPLCSRRLEERGTSGSVLRGFGLRGPPPWASAARPTGFDSSWQRHSGCPPCAGDRVCLGCSGARASAHCRRAVLGRGFFPLLALVGVRRSPRGVLVRSLPVPSGWPLGRPPCTVCGALSGCCPPFRVARAH